MSAKSELAWRLAVEASDLEAEPRIRPNPALWFWYALWGPLPERHSIWVLYDTTTTTWVLRHVARILAIAAVPIALIAIFLPAAGELRALTAFVAGSCALLFTVTWINEATEHRLIQAGYRWGLGAELRARRSDAQRLVG